MLKDCNPKNQKMRFFMKGFAQMFILAETSEKPTSGKEMMDAISSITDGMWCPSPGAAYPLLRKMEKEGLIRCMLEPGGGRRQILYSATPLGKKQLEGHRRHIAQKSERMFRLMMPLMLRILHRRKVDTSRKLAELSDLIMWNRTHMLSLPDKELEPEIDKTIAIFKKLKRERERK
jgi:DNA-binding PadR family transcriptional regulator